MYGTPVFTSSTTSAFWSGDVRQTMTVADFSARRKKPSRFDGISAHVSDEPSMISA